MRPPIMPGWDNSTSRPRSRVFDARARRQRRQHHGARRARRRPRRRRAPALRQGRHRHRRRHHQRRQAPPRRRGRGRRPRPRRRPACPRGALLVRQPRLPRGGRERPAIAAPAEIGITRPSNADIVGSCAGATSRRSRRAPGRPDDRGGARHLVSLLNPSVIVIGGSLAQAGESLIAGVREVVYGRSLPLATSTCGSSRPRPGAGRRLGAATMVIQHALTADRVDLAIASQPAS